jgi:hypothetical protein
MIQQLKTTKIIATEVAQNCPNSPDLELVGTQSLENCDFFKESMRAGAIKEEHLLRNAIGLNQNFYYSVQCLPNTRSCSIDGCVYERGIGYLYEKDNRVFLKRSIPVMNQYSDNTASVNNSSTPRPFKCCNEQSTVIVSSITPPTYAEALAVPNSVLASSEGFLPAPVQLQQNSFLVRLFDNILSLSFDSEIFSDIIINTLAKFTKQIKLKTSKLCVKRIQSDMIDLNPSSSAKAVKGSLYYDETTDTIKFYNGTKWKSFVCVDEE